MLSLSQVSHGEDATSPKNGKGRTGEKISTNLFILRGAATSWRSRVAQKDRILVARPFFIPVLWGRGRGGDGMMTTRKTRTMVISSGVGNGKRGGWVGEEGDMPIGVRRMPGRIVRSGRTTTSTGFSGRREEGTRTSPPLFYSSIINYVFFLSKTFIIGYSQLMGPTFYFLF